ncbi:MAG: N-acetylmuramoyl-L-alanine amidase [Oscillospiraceae bacterium]|nr:N-acetylmuramoyl-L-alanine amidase [Oscillospiraceae bacterium]
MKRKGLALLGLLGILAALLPVASAAGGTVRITEITPSAHSITICWDGAEAPLYEVCRAVRRSGVYVKVAETKEPTYTDTGLTQNSIYFYKVRPCAESGESTGAFSAVAGRCCVALVSAMATQNPCYQQGKTIQVSGLMLHSVGCAQEKGAVFASLWNQPTADVLVHAVVEPGGNVYQLADWNTRCWHCGGSGNNFLIGVEMTEPNELQYSGTGAEFTWSGDAPRKVVDNYNTAVALFANLCFQYNLNPLSDIYSHQEGETLGIASDHVDPEHLWSGLGLPLTMDTFRQDVYSKMQGTYRDRTASSSVSRTVTVKAELLNVRGGPGTGYEIQDVLTEGSRVTVTATSQSGDSLWGKLSTGGWISMEYVTS